jgi:hypothetical protein
MSVLGFKRSVGVGMLYIWVRTFPFLQRYPLERTAMACRQISDTICLISESFMYVWYLGHSNVERGYGARDAAMAAITRMSCAPVA